MNYVVQDTSLTAVADAIRKQTKSTEQISFPNGFVSEIESIDTESAYEQGQKAEYDKFWDKYQINGNRGSSGFANYRNAFQGAGWNKDTFYPKYDITGDDTAYQCFNNFNNESTYEPFDLAQRLEDCGVVLDTSQSSFLNAFQYCKVTRLPVIDTTGNVNAYINGCFEHCRYLVTIDKLILKEDPNVNMANVFGYCDDLENIVIEGVIGKNPSIQFSSKLTNESAKSMLLALYDYSGTENTFTQAIKFHANVWTSLDAEGNTSPNGNSWREYAQQKGWNI